MSHNKIRIIVFVGTIILAVTGGAYTRINLELGIAIAGIAVMVGVFMVVFNLTKIVLDTKESQLKTAEAETTVLQIQAEDLKSQIKTEKKNSRKVKNLSSQTKIENRKLQIETENLKSKLESPVVRKKEVRVTTYTKDDKEAAQWIFEGMTPRDAFNKKRNIYVLPEIEKREKQCRERGVQYTESDQKEVEKSTFEKFRRRVIPKARGKEYPENNNFHPGK